MPDFLTVPFRGGPDVVPLQVLVRLILALLFGGPETDHVPLARRVRQAEVPVVALPDGGVRRFQRVMEKRCHCHRATRL